MTLALETGGSGSPLLLLLHGLGANAAVWDGLIEAASSQPNTTSQWPGRWLAPDLRGHGRSPHAASYSLGTMAADVAEVVADEQDVTVVGHSMGGAAGILLASGWFGVSVRRIAVFGVKSRWDPELIAALRGRISRATPSFASQSEAADRALAVAGARGMVPLDSRLATRGVVLTAEGWRLSADPAANAVAGVVVNSVARSLPVPLLVVRGEHDAVVGAEEPGDLSDAPLLLDGVGHNPHIEAPVALWSAIAPFLLEGTEED